MINSVWFREKYVQREEIEKMLMMEWLKD